MRKKKGQHGAYPQVLADELKRPHKCQRVRMKLGRRQLKPLENPDLEIIEGQAHPLLFERKFIHGELFARICRAYPSVLMGDLEHPIGGGPSARSSGQLNASVTSWETHDRLSWGSGATQAKGSSLLWGLSS